MCGYLITISCNVNLIKAELSQSILYVISEESDGSLRSFSLDFEPSLPCPPPHAEDTASTAQTSIIMYACNCRLTLIGSTGTSPLLQASVAYVCCVLRCWANSILITCSELGVTFNSVILSPSANHEACFGFRIISPFATGSPSVFPASWFVRAW